MNLQRMQKLAGIPLKEGIMAIPGIGSNSESGMQTTGTTGRNQNYSNFDSSQGTATESAPPGEEGLVKKLKKEYPGHKDKAFATAWSIYNKKHGKKDESAMMENEVEEAINGTPDVVSCNQDNPSNADEACHMEENMDDLSGDDDSNIVDEVIDMLQTLDNQMVEYEDAFNHVREALEIRGYEEDEIDKILRDVDAKLELDGSREPNGPNDYSDDADALKSIGWGSDEDYGYYGNDEFEESFEADDPLFDKVLDAVAAIAQADGKSPDEIWQSDWMQDWAAELKDANPTEQELDYIIATGSLPKRLAHLTFNAGDSYQFGNDKFEEDYDFNNGYTVNKSKKKNDYDDYFPSGADSPVTTSAGPSGARQGDNPEQKKMAVTEVHKELVYSYRNFLKESKK